MKSIIIVTVVNSVVLLMLVNRYNKLKEDVKILHLSMSVQLLDKILFGEENNDEKSDEV